MVYYNKILVQDQSWTRSQLGYAMTKIGSNGLERSQLGTSMHQSGTQYDSLKGVNRPYTMIKLCIKWTPFKGVNWVTQFMHCIQVIWLLERSHMTWYLQCIPNWVKWSWKESIGYTILSLYKVKWLLERSHITCCTQW